MRLRLGCFKPYLKLAFLVLVLFYLAYVAGSKGFYPGSAGPVAAHEKTRTSKWRRTVVSLSLISYILCDLSGNFSVCVCKEEGIGDLFLQLEQCS